MIYWLKKNKLILSKILNFLIRMTKKWVTTIKKREYANEKRKKEWRWMKKIGGVKGNKRNERRRIEGGTKWSKGRVKETKGTKRSSGNEKIWKEWKGWIGAKGNKKIKGIKGSVKKWKRWSWNEKNETTKDSVKEQKRWSGNGKKWKWQRVM
jgi:hypothetical protein